MMMGRIRTISYTTILTFPSINANEVMWLTYKGNFEISYRRVIYCPSCITFRKRKSIKKNNSNFTIVLSPLYIRWNKLRDNNSLSKIDMTLVPNSLAIDRLWIYCISGVIIVIILMIMVCFEGEGVMSTFGCLSSVQFGFQNSLNDFK